MPSAPLLHELTREQATALAPTALAVFPVGATEQHGPHLPVGTDSFTVEYVARAAADVAAAAIPIVVTPTLPFGSSHHHLPFGGTMSLSTETYYRAVFELAESLVTGGFRRLFIVNGHGGNTELVHLIARDLALKHAVHVAAGPYWTIAWEELVAAAGDMPGRLPGHAGIYETSQILALRPEMVRKDRPHRDLGGPPPRAAYAAYRAESHGSWQAIDGYTDSPSLATAEGGQAYLAAVVGGVARALVEFYRATGGAA